MNASSVRPLRVGPVGYGLAGAASHAPLIATTDGPVLDAVVTANPQRHADASAALPGERIAVLEAAAASAREGRTVQLDGGGG